MILIMYVFGQIPAIIKAIQQTKLNIKAKKLIFGTSVHSTMLFWDFWMFWSAKKVILAFISSLVCSIALKMAGICQNSYMIRIILLKKVKKLR